MSVFECMREPLVRVVAEIDSRGATARPGHLIPFTLTQAENRITKAISQTSSQGHQPDAATGVDAPVTASLDGRAGITTRPTLLPPSWQWSASDGAGTDINTTAIILAEAHPPSTLEALTIASVIFIACVAIIMSNILIIATFVNFRGPAEVINIYLLSLAVADLLCGLLIVPLSVYSAMVQQWVYGDLACRLVGYLEVTLWSVSVFTFMWMSVDRYLAVQRPLRYDTVQKHTHCRCWMVFTWVSAAMLCCPPLLGFNKPSFDHDAYICMLDWGNMAAYSVTVAFLVLGPSLITIIYAYSYIFFMMNKLRSGAPIHDKEYASALSENLANPNHVMSFILVMAFWVSWTPYAGVKLYEYFTSSKFQIPYLHFGIVWLGILNSFWKALILIALSPQFRLAARIFCIKLCRRYKGRIQGELISMDEDD